MPKIVLGRPIGGRGLKFGKFIIDQRSKSPREPRLAIEEVIEAPLCRQYRAFKRMSYVTDDRCAEKPKESSPVLTLTPGL